MESNYKTILVPVDGSSQSEDALAKGAQFAKNNDAHLDVLHVLSTQQYGYNYGGMVDGDVINNLVEDTTDYLNKLVDRIKKNRVLTTFKFTFVSVIQRPLFQWNSQETTNLT